MHLSLPLPLPLPSLTTRTKTRTTSSTSICNICSTHRQGRGVSMGKLSGSRDRQSKLSTLLTYLPYLFFPLLFPYSICISFMTCPASHGPPCPILLNALSYSTLHCPVLPYLTLPCHAMQCTTLHRIIITYIITLLAVPYCSVAGQQKYIPGAEA